MPIMITHEVDKKTFDIIVELMKQTGAVKLEITHHPVGDCTLFHCESKYCKFLFGRHFWQDDSYDIILFEETDHEDYWLQRKGECQ